METIGDEEPKMYEEITPKECQADRMDCKGIEEISQQDRTMDSMERQPVLMDFQDFVDSWGSE